jgi:hypothetical protein
MGRAAMSPTEQSAEYYRLREGHERALALGARSDHERLEHLGAAARFASMARKIA